MYKTRVVILANETPNDHLLWVKACESYSEQIAFRIVDLTKNKWLENIQTEPFDVLLAKPGGLTSHFKDLYDERIYILERCLGYKLFPSAEEIFIYENKRFLSFWLDANRIPHPKTFVFYHKKEAIEFFENAVLPIVAKVNIGASGSGVIVLHKIEDAIIYLNNTFDGKGAKQRSGPNLEKGGLLRRGLHYVIHPKQIFSKIKIYRTRKQNLQKGFVIFQEHIPHNFEWRVVRIGDSFFAHKKLKIGEKASGSLLKNYSNPPLELLDFIKNITDKHQFKSLAVDIFETEDKKYLVNEMQCIFGQSDSYQMLVNGKAGRYRFKDKGWMFEEGDYNRNESFDLRIDWVLNSIK